MWWDINFFLPVGGFSVPDAGVQSVIGVVTAVLQFYDSGLSGAQLHCVCPLHQTLPGQCASQYTSKNYLILESKSINPDFVILRTYVA